MHLSGESTIPLGVNKSWLDIEVGGVTSRADLRDGLTRLGGLGCDVVIPGAPEGELHVWSDPPKVIRISGRAELEISGKAAEEGALVDGELIRWGAAALTYHCTKPVLEELVMEPPPLARPVPPPPRAGAERAPWPSDSQSPAPPANVYDPRGRAWTRVRAGIAIDLGVAERRAVTRWQDAVLQNEFDADACARDVLSGVVGLDADDPRVVERSGRLLRDFLMASLHKGLKGASRKMRSQARSGTAYLMANAIAISIYTAIVLVVMLLARLKWNTSFDALFDAILGGGPE